MKTLMLFFSLIISAYATIPDYTGELNFFKLKNYIEVNKIDTIECLLSKLPPEFMSGHTLMHTSKSLQYADPENPRAIIYGKDAKFVMTFNSVPKDADSTEGLLNLEILQYNDENPNSPFEFFEITFNKISKNKNNPCDETNSIPHFSNKNPSLCLDCHGQNPRPNWENYPSWPGAYGGNDDKIDNKKLINGKTEKEYLDIFLTNAPDHPRYRYLHNLNYTSKDPNPLSARTDQRHNSKLTQMLAWYNMDRVSRLIHQIEKPGVKNGYFDLLVIGINRQCIYNINELKSNFLISYLPDVQYDLFRFRGDYVSYNPYSNFNVDSMFVQTFISIGVDPSNWYMNFDPSDQFSMRTPLDNRAEFHYHLMQRNPLLAPLFKVESISHHGFKVFHAVPKNYENFCNDWSELFNQSKQDLENNFLLEDFHLEDRDITIENQHRGTFIIPKTCLKCHSAENPISETLFPSDQKSFENFALKDSGKWVRKIHRYIQKDENGKARMPLRRNLTTEELIEYDEKEYEQFRSYLLDLMKKIR